MDEPYRRRFWRFAGRLIGCAAVLWGASAAGAQGIEVSGQVVDAEHRSAIAGATVLLLEPLGSAGAAERMDAGEEPLLILERATTDDDGSYRLEAPAIGAYYLGIEAEGHWPLLRRLAPLLTDADLPPARLPAASPVTVRITDADGRPVADATAELVREQKRSRRRSLRRARHDGWQPMSLRLYTDAEGQLRVPDTPDGDVTFRLTAPGHAPFEAKFRDLADPVALDAGTPHTVRVVDARGRPAPDALVRVGRLPLGRTGEDGRLTVRVGDGAITLAAETSDGRGQLSLEPAARGEEGEAEPTEQTLTLDAVEWVEGVVLDAASSRPIPDALVVPLGAPEEWVRTDDRGVYTAEVKKQRVQAVASGYLIATASVAADATEAPTLNLSPASTVAGRVVDRNGEPVAEASVRVREVENRRRFRNLGDEARTRDNGTFRLPGIAADTAVELTVESVGHVTHRQEVEPLGVGEVRTGLEVVLDAALAVVGQVVDGDERPVVGAQVELGVETKGGDFQTLFRRARQQREPQGAATGADGRFRIEDIDPETYRLQVTAAGFAALKVPVLEVPADAGEFDAGVVVVVPGVTLEGKITDSEGAALGDVKVSAGASSRDLAAMVDPLTSTPLEVTSGPAGRFRLDDLSPGQTLQIQLKKEGYAAQAVNAVAPQAGESPPPLALTMEPATQLTVSARDADGLPIPNARVSVGDAGGNRWRGSRGRTSGDGIAEFPALVPGRFDVEVKADGFEVHRRSGLELGPGPRTLDISLERGLSFTGVVLDPSGDRVKGGTMVVLEPQGSDGFNLNRPRAMADDSGQFVLDGLEAGTFTLTAMHQEWGETRQKVDVAPGMAPIEVRFAAGEGVTVTGLVLDGATGEPVSVATVVLHRGHTAAAFNRGSPQARTDAQGRFEIKTVPPGTYTPGVTHADYAAGTGDTLEVGSLSVDGLVLEMGSGESIVGRLVGVPLGNLGETSIMAFSATGGMLHASPDFEGVFRFDRMAPGDWAVRASLPDGSQASERVVLKAGDGEVEIELDINAGFTVTGTVERGGEPAAGLSVRATHKSIFAFSETRTDSGGRFSLEGLEAGTYDVQVDERGRAVWRQDRDVQSDDDWTIDLRGGAVAGRVTDSGGQPLTGARVQLVPAGDSPWRSTPTPGTRYVTTDSFGLFDFGEVAEGSYRLTASKASYAQSEQALTVEGAPLTELELRLERSAGVTFRPQRTVGGVPQSLNFLVLGTDEQMVTNGRATVTDGAVHLDTLPPGSYRLLVAEAGGPTVELAIESPGDAGVVPIPQGGLVRLEMPDLFLDGGGATVEVRHPDGRLHRDASEPNWAAWLRGSAYQRQLPAGSFTLHVKANDGRTWQLPVTVIEGGVNELEVP
ncbi:MAG: carboxypeptidase regulatory-like domain-containing protein [Acidobacteriota bacterium]